MAKVNAEKIYWFKVLNAVEVESDRKCEEISVVRDARDRVK